MYRSYKINKIIGGWMSVDTIFVYALALIVFIVSVYAYLIKS